MHSNASATSDSSLAKSWSWLASSLVNSQSFSGFLEPLIQKLMPQWRADRIRSKIQTIRHESSDMYSLIIRPGGSFKAFSAGQYVELTVIKDGAWVSRFFSISSSPAYYKETGLIEISIRIQENGRITPWLVSALEAGSIVNLTQAQGEFVLPQHNNNLLMIAGGSGITPIRSMLQQLTMMSNALPNNITLMFYARSAEHFLFEQELKTMAQSYSWLSIDFINSEKEGFFNEDHLLQYCPDAHQRDLYICGPSPMITSARTELNKLNVKNEQIHYEFFGPEPSENTQTGSANILFSKSAKQISVNESNNKTLLDLAEQENTNPVSGCRMGVCHQCICQKKSGVVYNQKTQKYSDTGNQEIQLCISVPVGDVVLDL